jgi:hypothetical protein
MRAPGGNAAGFTGSATSSSRRSDLPIESGARAVNETGGPSSRSFAPGRSPVRPSAPHAIDAGNAGRANSSSRAKAAAGAER